MHIRRWSEGNANATERTLPKSLIARVATYDPPEGWRFEPGLAGRLRTKKAAAVATSANVPGSGTAVGATHEACE